MKNVILIHPPTRKTNYDYYLRQEFFFKEEKLVFEEENIKDSQVVVDRPFARIFNITPNLAKQQQSCQANIGRYQIYHCRFRGKGNDAKSLLQMSQSNPLRCWLRRKILEIGQEEAVSYSMMVDCWKEIG